MRFNLHVFGLLFCFCFIYFCYGNISYAFKEISPKLKQIEFYKSSENIGHLSYVGVSMFVLGTYHM